MVDTGNANISEITANEFKYIGNSYTECERQIVNVLNENNSFDKNYNFDLLKECFNFLKFTSSMLFAFPLGLYMRKKVRKNKRLNHIMQFSELLPVRNNIEKGSFAYDTILFKESPLQLLKNKSHLANLVCLAILFGDEFIDGVAETYGRSQIQRILKNNNFNYFLKYRQFESNYELFYEFDICDVLPRHVQEAVNDKYGITYKAFYDHLLFLLAEMNRHLNELKNDKAEEAAQLICSVCNRCFDTYKADINEFDENHSLTDLLQYQKSKDEDIIQILLTLRAVLLDKKQLHYQKLFASWGSMVRSMQLYDDMQDVGHDCGFQMNMLAFFSKNYFADEWQWLQQNKTSIREINGLDLHATVGFNMPCSCMLTLQYAHHITHSRLCWVQRKILNYLWRKNWLGFNNPLLNGGDIANILGKKTKSIPMKLHLLYKQIIHIDSFFISDNMKWAYIIDLALIDPELRQFVLKKISRKEKYQLLSCYLEFPIHQKAALAKKY